MTELAGGPKKTVKSSEQDPALPTIPNLKEEQLLASRPPSLQEVPGLIIDALRIHRPPAPALKQNDRRWGAEMYGTDTLANSGCGPTSACMALIAAGVEGINPLTIARISEKGGFRIPHVGTDFKLFQHLAQHYDRRYSDLSIHRAGDARPSLTAPQIDLKKIDNVLAQGIPVIIAFNNGANGHFTSSGHVSLIVGKNPDGTYKLQDPGPRNANKATKEQLLQAGCGAWAIYR